MDLVCLGEILIDMFPAETGRRLVEVTAFHPKPGGAPANAAVAAARLGATVAFIGKVGDDIFGHYLVEVLEREGVDTRGMRFDAEARTTMAIIALPDVNTAEFVFYRNPGADTRLTTAELDRALLEQTRAFHFGGVGLSAEPTRTTTHEAARIARAAGALVSFDVNYRPTLWKDREEARAHLSAAVPLADVVKLNEVELQLLTGSDEPPTASAALLEQGPRLVIVTMGARGSFFASRAGHGYVPAFKVETVDATGCGDAFIGALLVQLIRGGFDDLSAARLARVLQYANAAGALTATKQGVIPALPTAEQIEKFLQAQKMTR